MSGSAALPAPSGRDQGAEGAHTLAPISCSAVISRMEEWKNLAAAVSDSRGKRLYFQSSAYSTASLGQFLDQYLHIVAETVIPFLVQPSGELADLVGPRLRGLCILLLALFSQSDG